MTIVVTIVGGVQFSDFLAKTRILDWFLLFWAYSFGLLGYDFGSLDVALELEQRTDQNVQFLNNFLISENHSFDDGRDFTFHSFTNHIPVLTINSLAGQLSCRTHAMKRKFHLE